MLSSHLHNIITLPEWKIPNPTDFHNWFDPLYSRYEQIKNMLLQNFGSDGIYVMIAFALLLILIILIYLHSVLSMFKSKQPNDAVMQEDFEEEYDDFAEISEYDYKRQTALIEKEQELSANIIKMAEESVAIQKDIPANNEIQPLKKRIKIQANKDNNKLHQIKQLSKENTVHTDSHENTLPQGYSAIITMILNLLNRNVSEAKIIQALYAKFSLEYNEEEIISIVQTIRDFIGMCNSGKFDYIVQQKHFPSTKDALLALANGNSTPCLVLLQTLLNQQMDKADKEDGILQDLNYAIAANYACIMGNIARITDNDLAHNSYELATELSPRNVDAWNRLGDIFLTENSFEKAMIAYQNVLDIGDKNLYETAIANAQKNLSVYYEQKGWQERSQELSVGYNTFYESYGLKKALTSQESMVYNLIWQNCTVNLPEIVDTLIENNH